MNRKFSKKIIGTITALIGLLLVSTTPLAASSGGHSGNGNGGTQAGNLNPKVLPPASTPFGSSYAEWSVKWWQWFFSLEADNNPLDTGDCNAGQSGKVWFLAGGFETTTVTRPCTIPPGKALFIPLYNAWADNTACPVYTQYTVEELTGFTNWYMENAGKITAFIDGVPVKGVDPAASSVYRVGPQVFDYTLAQTDNILTNYLGPLFVVDLGCIGDGTTVAPVVADGVYLMLAPLSAGHHTINFTVAGFLDITYELTVRRK